MFDPVVEGNYVDRDVEGGAGLPFPIIRGRLLHKVLYDGSGDPTKLTGFQALDLYLFVPAFEVVSYHRRGA